MRVAIIQRKLHWVNCDGQVKCVEDHMPSCPALRAEECSGIDIKLLSDGLRSRLDGRGVVSKEPAEPVDTLRPRSCTGMELVDLLRCFPELSDNFRSTEYAGLVDILNSRICIGKELVDALRRFRRGTVLADILRSCRGTELVDILRFCGGTEPVDIFRSPVCEE